MFNEDANSRETVWMRERGAKEESYILHANECSNGSCWPCDGSRRILSGWEGREDWHAACLLVARVQE